LLLSAPEISQQASGDEAMVRRPVVDIHVEFIADWSKDELDSLYIHHHSSMHFTIAVTLMKTVGKVITTV
jgi:hypothetical protein